VSFLVFAGSSDWKNSSKAGDDMRDALRQINTVAGTMGSMVCNDHGHLISHLFPAIFDESMLRAAVTTVSENLPGLQDITGGVKMIDFRFQSGRVVVKPVAGGCLVILCENTINLQVLVISLNVVIKKIEKILKEGGTAPQQQVSAPAPTSSGSVASSQNIVENGPLATQLQGMQTTLAKFLGPMAKIVFLECVDTWVQTHQPVKATLPQLIDIVVKEIGDPSKMADYRQKVSGFL
jgi:predicted regulator of Ras-like GTPase activity (Roadblock/LC7/MglB family)